MRKRKKYTYTTGTSGSKFYATGIRKGWHTYSKRSSYGARTVWKVLQHVDLGSFPTLEEAEAAGKAWADKRNGPPPPPKRFEVIVGNIGTVYDGPLWKEALQNYSEYKKQSVANYGRAAGEPVSLPRDGEPHYEYAGTLQDG
jgi:hypothetical protein